ncbi:MAG: Maf family protein, partial [Pseudomonadota bacterium]|nr:Maf family protein [Pseudomonadota bacterium]
QKAQKVASQSAPAIIIGSDQVAVLDGEHIGKPGNHASALQQLLRMQGRTVIFHTALCVLDTRTEAAVIQRALVDTAVTFRNLPAELLDRYLRIEQPYDCAGSAKNEGLGIALIASLSSADPTALTGLPLIALSGMLIQAGVDLFNPGTQ